MSILTTRAKALALTLMMCVYSVSLYAQFAMPCTFTVKQKRVGDDQLEVTFTGKIDEGWHVYGTDIADGGPTKAELTIETQEGLKPVGKLREVTRSKRAMDDMFGMEVSFFEHKAVFAQTFQLTDATYKVSGYLTYGACNDENCIPPTDVEFSFKGEGLVAADKADAKKAEEAAAEEVATNEATDNAEALAATDSVQATTDSTATNALMDTAASVADDDLWAPVVDQLNSEGNQESVQDIGYLRIFLMGLLGGLVALLTPCVWPIIPMTVSFFLKRSKDRSKGVRDAITYGISIVFIYVLLGLGVTMLWGASALNALSTNAFFNIFFFLMLVVFGASFLGGFELTLPGKWTNAVDKKSEQSKGFLSIFLMAFTLSLVSFSCTGPIIGFLLVEVAQSGSILAPAIGMLGFALALALPFTLFALFPSWLKSAPKSGNWMNAVKVTLGFIELAFALKFFSVADLAYGWHLLDREVFLSIWIVLFTMLGCYLLGWIRFHHDEDEYDDEGNVVVRPRIGVPRFFLAMASLAFAIYMVPGLWGAPCKAVSAFAPPMNTQDFNLYEKDVEAQFTDYDEGMRYAQEHNMPVMLDFTGYGCVNCRKMEAAVWTDDKVSELIKERYVLITLYVDDKTSLPEVKEVMENGSTVKLRTIGDKWSYLQRSKFGANAQPFYVLVDGRGKPLTGSYSFDTDVEAYRRFLQTGLDKFATR